MRSERPMFSSSSTIRMRLDAIGSHGQQHAEARAAQFSFHQYDVAAAQQRAFTRDRKAQTHAAFLKGNGGLKEAGARLLTEPRSRVMYFDRNAAVLRGR